MRPTRFELATFGLKDHAEFRQMRLWEPVPDDRGAGGTGKRTEAERTLIPRPASLPGLGTPISCGR